MQKRTVIAVVVAILAVVVLVLLYSPLTVSHNPGASNTAGPAEGGALETGGALDQTKGYERLPARNMPNTVSEYPPTGPETASPPPPK